VAAIMASIRLLSPRFIVEFIIIGAGDNLFVFVFLDDVMAVNQESVKRP
jgi:hypothetical protein